MLLLFSELVCCSHVVTYVRETQNADDVTSQKPCLSLSSAFTWDTTTFSVPVSAAHASDTDSDSGFDSHDVRPVLLGILSHCIKLCVP